MNKYHNKALIAIIGPSGSGKSSSLENLDPNTTLIFDLERKGFPFKGSSKFSIVPIENAGQFNTKIAEFMAKNKVEKKYDLLVVESFGKLSEYILKLCQQTYSGYDIYGNYAKMIRKTLQDIKNDHCVVAFTGIDDIVDVTGGEGASTSVRMMEVFGKELRGKIEREFLMVLFTKPLRNASGVMEYWFQVWPDGITTTKTPKGMFDKERVPNDLRAVLDTAKKYFTE